jgi:hypothetical protein
MQMVAGSIANICLASALSSSAFGLPHSSFGPRPSSLQVETLRSVGGLPAHIAGAFEQITACEQGPSGDYFVFDRRSHSVFSVPAALNGPRREIVSVGVEPGRVLSPSAFDMAPDGSFAIADRPGGTPRIHRFLEGGARVGGFVLPRSDTPLVTLQGHVVSGVASLEYTGKTLLVSLPETGALITEYSLDGRPLRSFGELRRTGHEQDRDVHVALNTGRIVAHPTAGFYFVFLSGVPVFRKYDAAGNFVFERHIEGLELDEYLRKLPSAWPRQTARGEIPLVLPTVRAAEMDHDGNLWISLLVSYTYVYDTAGDKRRTLQFQAAGPLVPSGFFFTRKGQVLVTPGCYAFPLR